MEMFAEFDSKTILVNKNIARICANPTCLKEFVVNSNSHLYCSKRCCMTCMTRAYRLRIAVECLGCGKPTNAKGKRCKKCYSKHTSAIHAQMTLEEHYNSLEFIKRSPYQKNVQIRLYAKYHNRDLIGTPCQNCGYALNTNFCHIKPIRSFPLSATIGEVNSRDNILMLCPTCHWELDHGHLDPSDVPPRPGVSTSVQSNQEQPEKIDANRTMQAA